jgi:hypothetical protein
LEFPYIDEWCNEYGDEGFQVVQDCCDGYDKTKTFYEGGTNGVVPVDMFDAYCWQAPGNYQESAWWASWGFNGSFPECALIDRDGYIRKYTRAWPGDAAFQAYEDALKKLLGLYEP